VNADRIRQWVEFPSGICFDHGIEDDKQFSDASDLDELERLSGAGESLGESFDDGIAASRGKGGHVQDGAEFFSAAPDRAFATELATVAGVRGDSGECGDLLAIEFSKFWQLRDERGTGDGSDARSALYDLEFGSPIIIALEQLSDAAFDGVRLAFNGLEHLANRFYDEFIGRLLEPTFFGGALLDELPTACNEGIEEALFFGDFCLWSRMHSLGELGQDGGVESIGFGVLAEGLGEIAGLPRIDQGHGQVGVLDRQETGTFVSSGGFKDDQTGRQRFQMGDQFTATW